MTQLLIMANNNGDPENSGNPLTVLAVGASAIAAVQAAIGAITSITAAPGGGNTTLNAQFVVNYTGQDVPTVGEQVVPDTAYFMKQ